MDNSKNKWFSKVNVLIITLLIKQGDACIECHVVLLIMIMIIIIKYVGLPDFLLFQKEYFKEISEQFFRVRSS